MSNGTGYYNAGDYNQGFFSNLLGNIGNIGLGDLAGAGLSYANLQNYYDQYGDIAREAAAGAREIGQEASAASQFKPFTVSTGFGGITTTPEGGFGTTLSPEQQARQQALSGITGGLLGSYTGAGVPDVSGIQQQALGGVTGALTGFMTPMADREADVFERIRAVQRPEEERQRIALQEQLQAQGRTGLRTAQFGGSPEQFALAQAQEEAKNRAALAALGQAGTERQQDLAAAQGLFGLGTSAASLPASLQAAQLQNIGASLGLEYAPEQQLLSTLTPAVSLSNLAGIGQRQGAGLLSEAQMSALEDILQAEAAKAQGMSNIYSSIIGAGGQAAAGQSTANLFDQILGGQTLGGLFSSIFDRG
jgi:hypothetical protein